MKKLSALLFVLVVMVACSKSSPLDGKWEMKMMGMTSTIEYDGSSYKGVSDNPFCQESHGKFEVDESKSTVTIEITKSVGELCPKVPKTTMKYKVDGDNLHMTTQGMTVTYNRVK